MSNELSTVSGSLAPSATGLQRYMQDIKRFPILQPQEEYMLAKRYAEHDDTKAAEKLVTSHLRLVAKIAMGYRGYGLPMSEVVSEGNIGLMQAVKRFDPERGFRLSTYAMWWIRAAIQEYVLRSWSLVKIGTTAAQKRLFFNLKKLKNKLKAVEDGELHHENVEKIASTLGVSHADVRSMNQRLAGDASLNAPIKSDDGENGQWQDWLVDESDTQEQMLVQEDEITQRRKMLGDAMDNLNGREKEIFYARRLQDPPQTLEKLSGEFKISRERVRQIEMKAFEKVQKTMMNTTSLQG